MADKVQSYQTLFVPGRGLGPALPKKWVQESAYSEIDHRPAVVFVERDGRVIPGDVEVQEDEVALLASADDELNHNVNGTH